MNYGRYQIVKEVGRGSMGVVYEARDPHIDRVVAVKILRQDHLDTETLVQRFLKEAKVIGRLSHPNIVAIFDSGEEQGNVYITMEFLTGSSLADIVSEKTLKLNDIIAIGIQIAEALDYAHRKGVVHRDIKPGNIFVQPDGCIKISDFGIAHIDDSTTALKTQAGEILGTPSYMSPEQVLGEAVDGRSDLFTLGVILYELCTGKKAFGGRNKSLVTIFNEIINITPAEPELVEALIPTKLSGIIMQALQKEPHKRFQSGAEFADALRNSLMESYTPLILPPVNKNRSKRSVNLLTGILGFLLVAAVTIFFYLNTSPSSPIVPGERRNTSTPITPVGLALVNRTTLSGSHNLNSDQIKNANSKRVELKIRTLPPGAGVSIDGVSQGISPITLMLTKGPHAINLDRPGFQRVEKKISIEETMEYPLVFELRAAGKPD